MTGIPSSRFFSTQVSGVEKSSGSIFDNAERMTDSDGKESV